MSKKTQVILLIILILILVTINYSYLDSLLTNFLSDSQTAFVERIIDGDTIVIENTASLRSQHENLSRGKTSVRLLGINSPEKGERYYAEAGEFLEMIILGKEVELRFGKEKYDKYQRKLAYVFYQSENINLGLVRNGFANFYFPSGKDIYYDDFKKAWEDCIESNKYLCEKSSNECVDCIELKELNFKQDEIIFHNKCDFNCDLTAWWIKDEGRKKFIFPEFILKSNKNMKISVGEGNNNQDILFWENEEYVFTKTGDTLFLRDNQDKLVLWKNY